MFFIKCWQNAASYKSNYLHWTLGYVYLTFFFLQLWYPLVILHFIKNTSLLSSFLQKQQQKQSCVLCHLLYYYGCTALLVALVVVSGAILNTHLYLYLYRQTDRRTDGRTELLYQYRASAAVCWRAIKTNQYIETLSHEAVNRYQSTDFCFPLCHFTSIEMREFSSLSHRTNGRLRLVLLLNWYP